MSYQKNMFYVSLALLFLLGISSTHVFAYSFLPPPAEKTGAPNEGTCMECHFDNELNAEGGSFVLTTPDTYEPNAVYTIIVDLARAGQVKWGFEMTAVNAGGAAAGEFKSDDSGNTALSEAAEKQYIHHTLAGTATGTPDAHRWEFQWIAPDADVGPVTFYAAGNAANDDGSGLGDYVYTAQSETTAFVPVAGVSLEVVGDTEGTTMDAIAGVTYTLKVTNTGNIADKVTLAASAEIGIEGSVLGSLSHFLLELDAGASAEVTLKVAGDFFTQPGEYTLDVTATSDTDNTMAATITTTTTIEMEPEPEVIPAETLPSNPADLNDDGIVNIQDLVLVAGQFGQVGEGLKADLNGDGRVNVLDLIRLAADF